MKPTTALALGASVLALLACSGLEPAVHATLQADSAPFTVQKCYSGDPKGFDGIELVADDEARVRLVQNADGTADVVYFEPGADTGTELGTCAEMMLEESSVTVNDVRGLDGQAQLDCTGGAHEIVGNVAFERCATDLF